MNNLQNLYEVRKTVRFELKPSRKENFESGDIKNFLVQVKKIEEDFSDLFFYSIDENTGEIELSKKRKIKYGFLRAYTKNKFYDWKKEKNKGNTEKDYDLTDIEYLPEIFFEWKMEWGNLHKRLEEYVDTDLHEQKRKSEIAFVVKQFGKRQNFEFIKEFVLAIIPTQNTEIDTRIENLKAEIKTAEENLKKCEKQYLPSQSGGILLKKASLNYYTLNKDIGEYERQKRILQKEREKIMKDWKDKNGKSMFWFDRKFNFGENHIDEAYEKIKDWKAQQKKDFNEQIGNVISDYLKKGFDEKKINQNAINKAKEVLQKFPLFTPKIEVYFVQYLECTKEMKILSAQKNEILQKNGDIKAKDFEKQILKKQKKNFPLSQDEDKFKKLTEKIISQAQIRGDFFNKPKKEGQVIQTQNYKDLCELYKKVAMERGKIIARLKGIEHESVQSQLLTHWALLAENGENKMLVLVPRGANDNHKKTHEFLEKDGVKNRKKQERDITVFYFKSLTFRALEKLCFKRLENPFEYQIKRELQQKGYNFVPRYKEEWRKQPQKLVKFYQDVLQTNYVKNNLDLSNFSNLKNALSPFLQTIEDFEKALETSCYIKIPVHFSKQGFEKFCTDYGVEKFDAITTQSVEGKKKENAHAKIWKSFWGEENEDKNYPIRLNPELSIFYRDALDDRIECKNRFSAPRYTLATTITLGATNKKSNLQFKETQEMKNYIQDFNQQWEAQNQEILSQKWYFGIDRGLKELATLNVVQFADTKNGFRVSEPKDFAKIPVYTLKDENAFLKDENEKVKTNFKGEQRKVIDNISEVLEKGKEPDDRFEKKEVSSIDLTQAKFIKGHIVLNGDQKTYLKLKELSAKRRIFELFSTSKINKDSGFTGNKVWSIGGYEIYWLTEWQRQDGWKKERDDLKKTLEEYLKNLDTKNTFEDVEDIEKINHLRDAITANMVGILWHLQSTIGKGYIALENMDISKPELEKRLKEKGEKDEDLKTGQDKKMIDEHFDQSNQDISRRLEWALFRKFANSGDVPPQIKQSIVLRDEFEMYQIGILKYVKVGGTSSNCPNCGERSGKTGSHFVCKYKENDCTFDSRENRTLLEEKLHNSDEVAAYNVAKNGFENIYEQ